MFEGFELLIVIVFILWLIIYMMRPIQPLGNWQHFFDGIQVESKDFFKKLKDEIEQREFPDIEYKGKWHFETSYVSTRRQYMRITYADYTIDVCCSHFGTGSYVSWWLGHKEPGILGKIPVLNILLGKHPNYKSYFQIDTARMFRTIVHQLILKQIDHIGDEHGKRPLTELERMPQDK